LAVQNKSIIFAVNNKQQLKICIMGKRTIPASELPKISGVVKDVVNMGLWFLYAIAAGNMHFELSAP